MGIRPGALPTDPGPVETELEWIENRALSAPAGETRSGEPTGHRAVSEWAALRGHFAELDDVRFKVEDTRADGTEPAGPKATRRHGQVRLRW